MEPNEEKQKTWLTLLPLAALLAACASSLPLSSLVCPEFPPMPAVSVPALSPTFSEIASERIKTWRSRLTDSSATSEP